MPTHGEKWIMLLRWYAAHDDGSEKALFHERMERNIERLEIPPIEFIHPMEEEILDCFDPLNEKFANVLLTGDAGVGKTRLIHRIHTKLRGDKATLRKSKNYWTVEIQPHAGQSFQAHINRDLSAWRLLGATSEQAEIEEAEAIEIWSKIILGEEPLSEVKSFLAIAANDGQLLKAFRDYSDRPQVRKAYEILEKCLQQDIPPPEEIPLKIFHLASLPADKMFELCLNAVLENPAWEALELEHGGDLDIFGPTSPLRKNRDALKDPIIQKRLFELAKLCDSNNWHFPTRYILAMIANALLGMEDGSGVLNVEDLRKMISENRLEKSNFFKNILGLNLTEEWREKVFGPIESFRVGNETTNQADNLILFGPEDPDFTDDYNAIFSSDTLFPPSSVFEGMRREYLNNGPSTPSDEDNAFHTHLIAERRRLFFRTPAEMESDYNPWNLTNFHYAKQYLEEIIAPTSNGVSPEPKRLPPLITALNRVWTGLLLDEDNQLLVTSALDYVAGRSSEIEMRRVPTRGTADGEFPYVDLELASKTSRVPRIAVYLREGQPPVTMPLTLTRYEFLRRVEKGALPASFSRECSEDIRSFKSRILARLNTSPGTGIKLLHATKEGGAGTTVLALNSF